MHASIRASRRMLWPASGSLVGGRARAYGMVGCGCGTVRVASVLNGRLCRNQCPAFFQRRLGSKEVAIKGRRKRARLQSGGGWSRCRRRGRDAIGNAEMESRSRSWCAVVTLLPFPHLTVQFWFLVRMGDGIGLGLLGVAWGCLDGRWDLPFLAL